MVGEWWVAACPSLRRVREGLLRGHRDKDLFGGAGSLSDFVMGKLRCGIAKIHTQLGQMQVADNAHSADALNGDAAGGVAILGVGR